MPTTALLLLTAPAAQLPVHERVGLNLPFPAPTDWMGRAVALEGTRVLVGVPTTTACRGRTRARRGSSSAARAASGPRSRTCGRTTGRRTTPSAGRSRSRASAPSSAPRTTTRAVDRGRPCSSSATRTGPGARRLTASDAAPLDNFGSAVALEGERALVGAPAKGFVGAAYVFERDSSRIWRETAKLLSEDTPILSGSFGQSVALSGQRALVGDRTTGAAYVFERGTGEVWSLAARLQGSASASSGFAVSSSGDRAGILGPPRAALRARARRDLARAPGARPRAAGDRLVRLLGGDLGRVGRSGRAPGQRPRDERRLDHALPPARPRSPRPSLPPARKARPRGESARISRATDCCRRRWWRSRRLRRWRRSRPLPPGRPFRASRCRPRRWYR